jgi:hypothetical protein
MSNKPKAAEVDRIKFDMQKIEVAVTKMVDEKQLKSMVMRGEIHQFYDKMVAAICMTFTSFLWGAGKEQIDVDVKVFPTWWDHTKARWCPKWILQMLPFGWGKVNIDHHIHKHEAFKAVCPHLDGDPVNDHVEWVMRSCSFDEKDQQLADKTTRIYQLSDELKLLRAQIGNKT